MKSHTKACFFTIFIGYVDNILFDHLAHTPYVLFLPYKRWPKIQHFGNYYLVPTHLFLSTLFLNAPLDSNNGENCSNHISRQTWHKITYYLVDDSVWTTMLYVPLLAKGQIKPKAEDSPEKRICFVYREKQKSKQQFRSFGFFGRIYGTPICFWFYLTFIMCYCDENNCYTKKKLAIFIPTVHCKYVQFFIVSSFYCNLALRFTLIAVSSPM